jgi:cytochrome P450
MTVYVSSQSLHFSPSIWGADVAEFRPSRWIDPKTGSLITPPKGSFLPWSGGPRVCPGMKMAQVEFVATLATLFKNARCEALRVGDETQEDVTKRLRKLVENSQPRLSLQMMEPKEVKLRWVRDG